MYDGGTLRVTHRVQPPGRRSAAGERYADVLHQRQDVQRVTRDLRRVQGDRGQYHRAHAAHAARPRTSLMRSRQAIALFALVGFFVALFVIHAICRWCVGSAVIITATWIVALLSLRSPALRTDPAASPPPRDRPA